MAYTGCMGEPNSLTNHLLIAMPALADPNFAQTVTLICEHSGEGALGNLKAEVARFRGDAA